MPGYTELRQQVEDLALRLVLAGSGSEADVNAWTQALETIQSGAIREGAVEAAEAARNLIGAIQTCGTTDPAPLLQEGFSRLQQALEATHPPEASLAQDPELLSDFILESREHLANVESQLLVLERDPGNSEALHAIFRSFHTIKGLAGFLELREIQRVAHEVESVLDLARNLQFRVTPEAIDVILLSGDYLKQWLGHLELVLQKHPSSAPDL